MDKVIAICDYIIKKVNVYVRETEDGYFRWYDEMGESEDFCSEKEAIKGFFDYAKSGEVSAFIENVSNFQF